MLDLDDNIFLQSLVIYLISCWVLYNLKHEKMFNKDGSFKCFGLRKTETIYPFWLVTLVIGILSYFILRMNSKKNLF